MSLIVIYYCRNTTTLTVNFSWDAVGEDVTNILPWIDLGYVRAHEQMCLSVLKSYLVWVMWILLLRQYSALPCIWQQCCLLWTEFLVVHSDIGTAPRKKVLRRSVVHERCLHQLDMQILHLMEYAVAMHALDAFLVEEQMLLPSVIARMHCGNSYTYTFQSIPCHWYSSHSSTLLYILWVTGLCFPLFIIFFHTCNIEALCESHVNLKLYMMYQFSSPLHHSGQVHNGYTLGK